MQIFIPFYFGQQNMEFCVSSSGDARIEDVSLCHCSVSHLLAPLLNEVLIIVGFSFCHGVQFSSWGSVFVMGFNFQATAKWKRALKIPRLPNCVCFKKTG